MYESQSISILLNKNYTSFTVPSVAARVEMKNIQTDFKQGNFADIPVRIRSMKRLLVGKELDGLIKRR